MTNATHKSHPREYSSYHSMRQRCLNPNRLEWQYYGGRSAENGGPVVICARWLNSFANFVADMGERPDGTTLDRIDNRKGYTPKNTRWADPKTQGQNKTNVAMVIMQDGPMLVSEAAGTLGKKPGTVLARRARGYETPKALAADLHVRKKMAGKYEAPELHKRTVKELARMSGVNYSTALTRIQRGVCLADALKPAPARARAA